MKRILIMTVDLINYNGCLDFIEVYQYNEKKWLFIDSGMGENSDAIASMKSSDYLRKIFKTIDEEGGSLVGLQEENGFTLNGYNYKCVKDFMKKWRG